MQRIKERVQRWNHQWRELGARRRAASNTAEGRQYVVDRRVLRREGQALLQSEGVELDSNPDEDPPGQPPNRPAAERRSDEVPEQDRRREGDPNERHRSTILDPDGHARSDRSGSREGSSGRSDNPPPSEPPSYHSNAPTYHTDASTGTDLPTYRPPLTRQQRLDMEQDPHRHENAFDQQRSPLPRRRGQ